MIIDSEPAWEEVRRGLVAERGGQWLDDSQQRLMGMSTAEWSRYLAEDLGTRMTEKAVADEVIARMRARYDSHLPLIPGAVEAVRRVAASWPLGLASSSPRRLIDAVLARAGLDRLFAATVSTEEVARGKPAPDVYQAVARMLGSLPGDCVAVEDSGNGLRAAVAAGMRTVLVARPEYPVDAEVRQTAALTLGDIQQLTPHALVALDR